ncbi:MAG: response regulator [Sedimenticola sp.]
MDSLLLKTERPALLSSVRVLRHLLDSVSQACAINKTLSHRIQLCFTEAATNVIEHSEPSAGTIGLRFGRNANQWWLEIIDDGGSWRPDGDALDSLTPEQSEDEGGRGLGLMESQSDTLLYMSSGDKEHNCLRMSWNRSQTADHPRVLVVEDDAALRRLYEAYLDSDFEVHSVSGGREALTWLEQQPVDLVLSDITMPEMDGMTLREQMVDHPDIELTSFVFLTANEEEASFERAGHLGIDDYLLKPVTRELLLHTLQRVITRTRQVRAHLSERINRRISSALKPRLPEITPGWKLSLASRHTGSGGGDLLLFHQRGIQTLLLLADIMGHDDTAKFFTHAYAGYLHGLMQGMTFEPDPGKLLEMISHAAWSDELLKQTMLTSMTLSLGEGGRVTIACGGHPAPLKVDRQGIRSVAIGGVMPGLLPDNRYDTTDIHLQAGERLALFTDGLFESAASAEGRKRLEQTIIETLHQTRSLPQEEALLRVMEQFDQLTGHAAGDDTLLLLMEPKQAH